MKKILGLFLALGISSSLFAYEMDLTYSIGTGENYKYKFDYEDEYTHEEIDVKLKRGAAPFGLDINYNWPFGHPDGIFEAGLSLDTGFDLASGLKSEDYNADDFFGLGYWLTLGPMFRLNPHNRHSVTFSPGFSGGVFYATDNSRDSVTETVTAIHFDFSINTAYKFWLVNRPGWHFGLNLGLDWKIPLAGVFFDTVDASGDSSSDSYELKNDGANFKLKLGVCFNVGDRSIDRKNGTTAEATNATAANSATPPVYNSNSQTPPPVNKQYNVVLNGQSTGPYDKGALGQMIRGGVITKETMVWTQGMNDWQAAGSVSDLKSLF